jgi:REP element-mobilizing transposase RayT
LGSAGTSCDLSVDNSNELNKKLELNEFGKIVQDRILWLAEQYQYVAIHNYVVMPNHVHAIIEIDSRKLLPTSRDLTVLDLSVRDEEIKIKSLSSLIGAFKTTSSKMIHQAGFLNFAWQRSFHDHIIRNEKAYFNISNYIDTNPEKWMVDTFFEKH